MRVVFAARCSPESRRDSRKLPRQITGTGTAVAQPLGLASRGRRHCFVPALANLHLSRLLPVQRVHVSRFFS